MATKKDGKPKAAKKKAKGGKGNITRSARYLKKVRVKINQAECARKEATVTELENQVQDAEESMAPYKKNIRKWRKEIKTLSRDVKSNTEERDQMVYDERDHVHQIVKVRLVSNNQVVDERTMEKGDDQQTDHLLDQDLPGKETNGASDLTPGEAIAAAREEVSDEDAGLHEGD